MLTKAITKRATLSDRFNALICDVNRDNDLGEIQELAWHIKSRLLMQVSQAEIDRQTTEFACLGGLTPLEALSMLTHVRYFNPCEHPEACEVCNRFGRYVTVSIFQDEAHDIVY
jgi:hypothetical protein